MHEVLQDAEKKMKGAIEATVHDFGRIRTGRASAVMLEKITVDYYGTETPITQIANVSSPEPRQLLVTPWEKNMMGPIEKAIQKSDLGINPNSDGIAIRLNFPPMTEDRRREMVKQVHVRAEEGMVAVRNVRRDANDKLKAALKAKEISEDDLKGLEKKVQELTDKYVAEVGELQKKKDAEVMEV